MEEPIQPFIINASVKPVKKHVNLRVNEKPLSLKGLPLLPSKLSDSKYLNVSEAVPYEWRREMDTFMRKFNDNDRDEKVTNRFAIMTKLNWQTVHILSQIIQTQKTTLCYDTAGYLDKVDESVKLFKPTNWRTTIEHNKLLYSIHHCTGDRPDDINDFCITARSKRAHRDPAHCVTTPEGRSFVYVSYYNENGLMQFSWVDISNSAQLPLPIEYVVIPNCCQVKGCVSKTDLSQCSRCKNVFYCSRLHQKEDWSSHKLNCK